MIEWMFDGGVAMVTTCRQKRIKRVRFLSFTSFSVSIRGVNISR